MKKLLSALFALLMPVAILAQSTATSTVPTYIWPAAAATGVIAPYLNQYNPNGLPSNFTITVTNSGTVPSACTFEVESSEDGLNWSTGTTSLSGSQSCVAAAHVSVPVSIAYKPVTYIQIKVLTLTGADGTTTINFRYTRGK